MRPPLRRRTVLSLATLALTGSIAGCQGIAPGPVASDPTGEETDPHEGETVGTDDSLGLAYSEGNGPFRRDGEAHSGWVHVVADGESADLTFDARFCAGLGPVEPTLRGSLPGEYVLGFETGDEASRRTAIRSPDGGPPCASGTRLVGGANVPNDWETLVVEVNGAEVQTIERSGTTPVLRPLPDPIWGSIDRRTTSSANP